MESQRDTQRSHRPATRAQLMMSAPDFFEVSYKINPWMDPAHWAVSAERLAWMRSAAGSRSSRPTNASGATVEVQPAQRGLPDMVFTANAGVVLDRKVTLARFLAPSARARNRTTARSSRRCARGVVDEVIDTPAGLYFEGAGDAIWDRHRSVLWTGYGQRSSREMQFVLGETYGVPTVGLELVDPRFYHLDTCFCVLGRGDVLYYRPAFSARALELIEDLVGRDRLIEASDEDACHLAVNSVALGDDAVFCHATEGLRGQLAERGYRTHVVPLDSFNRSGGAAYCLTLRLDVVDPAGRARRAAVRRGRRPRTARRRLIALGQVLLLPAGGQEARPDPKPDPSPTRAHARRATPIGGSASRAGTADCRNCTYRCDMRVLPAADRDNPITSLRIDTRSAAASAPADTSPERRAALERELDRVQTALLAERASYIPLFSSLLIVQGLFLIAFCVLLTAPTAVLGSRGLLAGVAGFGAAITLLAGLLLRPMREAMTGLRNQRRDLESKLYKDFHRRPIFAPRSLLTRGLAGMAASALPLLCTIGWIALAIVALAASPKAGSTSEAAAAKPTALQRPRPRTAPAPAPRAGEPAGRTGCRRGGTHDARDLYR